jgi:hypothetical protein
MAGIAAAAIIGGLGQVAGGLIGSGRRRREAREAAKELRKRQSQYEAIDTSNVFANLENTAEEMTVNQQAANFMAQQQQQGLSNVLDSMNAAAGGSGIAALAQAMANQQNVNLQKASADIGKQEQNIQLASANQANQIQFAEAKGELMSRNAQRDKIGTFMGMAQNRLAGAQAAQQQATDQMIQGGVGIATGVAGGLGGEGTFMQNIGMAKPG